MNKNKMSATDYPPPPPPPPPATSSKRSSKTMIAALVVVFAVVVIVGAYYATTLNINDGNNPSPSASHSPSATSTSSSSPTTSPYSSASPTSIHSPTSTPLVTATPASSGQTYMGYRVGAWANYTESNYDGNGTVTASYDLGYSVDEGIIKGVDCWLLQTELKLSADGSVMKTVATYWLDKSSLKGLHYKIVISSNGLVISNTENDYSPGDVNDIPTAINQNTVISHESVMVPAGTFNCDKASTTTKDLGNTYVTTVWGNPNIPVVGMVKQELTSNGALISSTELVAYGG
jgi:hypothetical protein